MTYRPVGDSGLMVSAVGIGCNAFARRVDLAGVNEILNAAQEVGVTLLDTADIYGDPPGGSEVPADHVPAIILYVSDGPPSTDPPGVP